MPFPGNRTVVLLLTCLLIPVLYIHAQSCSCNEHFGSRTAQLTFKKENIDPSDILLQSANKICRARGYEWKATRHIDNNQLDSAEIMLQKAESILSNASCGDSLLLQTKKIYARLYYTKGDFASAQQYSFQYLQAAEVTGDLYEKANAYTMIAQLFNQTGQAGEGIIYNRRAVALLPKISFPAGLVDLYFKISKRYLWHYQDTKTMASLDSSELFSKRAIDIARNAGLWYGVSSAFNNLEGVAWEREDYKKALALLDSSFKYISPDQYNDLGINYFDKADLLLELQQPGLAGLMADSALYYYELIGARPYIADVYELKARIASQNEDYKEAYQMKEEANSITDSIRSADAARKVAELEKKYNQAKNEKTIKVLAQQKSIYILMAAACLFALIGLIFFVRQQALKNKQRILEAEQRLNRARMNPHFFFNALSSLQSYALESNDGKAIAGNLSKFSHIMRETLESTYKEYVTLEQETGFLSEYLELQKIRFPQKFDYTIRVAGDIEPDDTIIPSMILQPFAENSIEHGFAGIDHKGELLISFSKEKNSLLVNITDNGKGLSQGVKDNSNHISRASQIIKDRIYLLNIRLKTRASFAIDDNSNGKGVTVQIQLPLLYRQDFKA